MSVIDLLDAYRRRERSPVEVVRETLQRADAVDQDLAKGAVEDGPNTLGNANADHALDEGGLPSDEVAIADPESPGGDEKEVVP